MSVVTEPLLNWPPNLGRSKAQRPGTFRTSFAAAYQHVLAELKRMRVPKATVSGNLAVNRSGHASAEQLKSGDVGIAVHFTFGGELFVIAVDQYTTREANMQAIAHTLAACRTIERHGQRRLLRQALEGFRALTPGTILALPAASWYRVLGFMEPPPTLREARSAYEAMLKKAGHPDHGGDEGTFRAAAAAMAEARTFYATKSTAREERA